MTPVRAATLCCAVVALVLGASRPAWSDSVQTTSGQTLRVVVRGVVIDGRAVGRGAATITDGPTTIRSVQVSFDDHEEIPVGVDGQGRFVVDVPWPGATTVTVRATATASDGTTVTSTAEGTTEVPHRAAPAHRRHLADTGAPGPRILGPLGLLLVLVGIRLAAWGRAEATEAPLEEDRILGT